MRSGPDVLIEALNRVAAEPSAWDALIEALPADPGPDADVLGALAVEHARAAAALRRLPDEGVDARPGSAIGWIVISHRGRVLADNGSGIRAIADLIELDPAQRLKWRRHSNALLVAAAARRALLVGGQVAVRLERGRNEASLYGLAGPPSLWPALTRGLAATDLAGAVCLVFPSTDQDDRLSNLLRGSFGLTEAETRLAQRLSDGLSLRQIADEFAVSPHTVRNHLRAVFDKVGVQRQGDLIRALSQLASLGSVLAPVGTGGGLFDDAPSLRLIRLPDGRRLYYRDYGDPQGRPLISLHEGLGSSLPAPGADTLARGLGLRIIAPDRPGYGLSDPRADYSFDSVADDLSYLVARLAVRDAAAIGVATGAVHALYLAKAVGHQMRIAVLASPQALIARPPADNPFQAMRRRLESQPLIAEAVMSIVRLRHSPAMAHRMLDRVAAASPGDRAVLASTPWAADYVSASASEALAVSTRGPIADLAAFRAALGTPFPQLSARVEAWCGAEDVVASPAQFALWAGAAAEVHRVEGVGHLLPLGHWSDLLRRARSAWD